MVGLVTSQGDVAMRADIARQLLGVDGTGITIGIISNSFDVLGTASQDVANGDLPSNVSVLADLPPEIGQLFGAATDEGRAMAQLIHDVAPGANLMFHTGFSTQPTNDDIEFLRASTQAFANAIRALAAAGADIIVDDISALPTDPFFQDGIVAQAINEVAAQGVLYFTSAGNRASNSYESTFNASGVFDSRFVGQLHDFDPGLGVDTFQSITIPVNSSFNISFQWDSPFFSLSPSSGGSPNDLDIFLLDNAGNIVASSTQSNVGGDPLEILRFTNDGSSSSDQFNLAIALRTGTAPSLIKYVGDLSTATIAEYNTASSTVFGHKSAVGAVAVGAAPFYETPEFGVEPPNLQFFSSVGGTPILFDQNGNRLPSPQFRLQPRIVAPDNSNTTFFGWDIPQDSDTFPNFPGTSAAAPHAAAVAALILQANPTLSSSQVYTLLERTALDMDNPGTSGFDVGYDFATGYGYIQADAAVALAFAQRKCGCISGLNEVSNGTLVSSAANDPSLYQASGDRTNFNPDTSELALSSLFESWDNRNSKLIPDVQLAMIGIDPTPVQFASDHYGIQDLSPLIAENKALISSSLFV